nr:hypothetical protein [Tanacetum cinerariifolium]
MVGGNGGNQFRQNGNLVAARAEGNETEHNGNQIRCYNCRGLGHFARNCTVKPRRRDAAYLQTQLLIAQKEEAGIQLQAEEFDLMAVVVDLDEIEEVNANYGSAEVHNYKDCYDNEIFNMFTQEEQYTELLKPIPEPHQVRSTIVTLQRVVKHRMTLKTHNWSSSVHKELHKIVKDENFPIVNQVDARVQNFEIQFLKEAAKFVGDFKSLAKEADESLAKYKALELEIKHLLRAVVKRFENRVIKKENEYAKLWNDWYKTCDECKYDKISYDKAYKNIQQQIKRLQAQLGDLKGKSKDTSGVSDTLNPLS